MMSRATALWVVLAGIFAFAAMAVLIPYAPDLRRGDDGGAHALSRSAVGFAGLAEGLRLAGQPVTINRAPFRGSHASGLLVVTPGVSADRNQILPLARGFDGPVLVILPKWVAAPDPHHRGWTNRLGTMHDPVPDEPQLPGRQRPAARRDQAADAHRPWGAVRRRRELRGRAGRGRAVFRGRGLGSRPARPDRRGGAGEGPAAAAVRARRAGPDEQPGPARRTGPSRRPWRSSRPCARATGR